MPRSYAVTALTTFFLVSTCIWIFSFIVDPYDLYPGVPKVSPGTSVDLFYYLRLHKPYAVERIQPELLIVGDSRSAALPPQPLQVMGGVAYNAALPGTSLREIRLMVEHAQAIKPLKFLLIGIDYQMFQEGKGDQIIFGDVDRYRKIDASLLDRLRHSYQRLDDLWRSLYSVDAMMDSWRVLFGQGRSDKKFNKDGTWDFDSRVAIPPNRLYATRVRQTYRDEITAKTDPFAFDELANLLDFTDVNDIRVILLIAPMQGLLMRSVFLAGTWDNYLSWQRELVALVVARNTDTKIYGVEDNPQLVLEAINTPQPLFHDGLHFNREAGMEITTCLVGPCNSIFQPTRLDSQSIHHYLETVEALRRQYEQDNPSDVAAADKWLQ